MVLSSYLTDTVLLFQTTHKFMTVNFGCTMTAIRLKNGDVVLHSPISIDDQTFDTLTNFGCVKHIISPSLMHHSYLTEATQRFPEATVYGVSGLEKIYPSLLFKELNDSASFNWSLELQYVCLKGIPKLNECIFYHQQSQSIIVTDLLFNISNKSGWSKLFFKCYGIYNRLTTTKLFKTFISDKDSFKKSLDKIIALPKKHIIMSHGSTISEQANETFKNAFNWI